MQAAVRASARFHTAAVQVASRHRWVKPQRAISATTCSVSRPKQLLCGRAIRADHLDASAASRYGRVFVSPHDWSARRISTHAHPTAKEQGKGSGRPKGFFREQYAKELDPAYVRPLVQRPRGTSAWNPPSGPGAIEAYTHLINWWAADAPKTSTRPARRYTDRRLEFCGPWNGVEAPTIGELLGFVRGLAHHIRKDFPDKTDQDAMWRELGRLPIFRALFCDVQPTRSKAATWLNNGEEYVAETTQALSDAMALIDEIHNLGTDPFLAGAVAASLWGRLKQLSGGSLSDEAARCTSLLTSAVYPETWHLLGHDGCGLDDVVAALGARTPAKVVARYPPEARGATRLRKEVVASLEAGVGVDTLIKDPKTVAWFLAALNDNSARSEVEVEVVGRLLELFAWQVGDGGAEVALAAVEAFIEVDRQLPPDPSALPAVLALGNALIPHLRTHGAVEPSEGPSAGGDDSLLDEVVLGAWLARSFVPHLKRAAGDKPAAVAPEDEGLTADLHKLAGVVRRHLTFSMQARPYLPSAEVFEQWVVGYAAVSDGVKPELQWEGWHAVCQILRSWPFCQPEGDKVLSVCWWLGKSPHLSTPQDTQCFVQAVRHLSDFSRTVLPPSSRAQTLSTTEAPTQAMSLDVREAIVLEARASLAQALGNLQDTDRSWRFNGGSCATLMHAGSSARVSVHPVLPVLLRCCEWDENKLKANPKRARLYNMQLANILRALSYLGVGQVPKNLPSRLMRLGGKSMGRGRWAIAASLASLGCPDRKLSEQLIRRCKGFTAPGKQSLYQHEINHLRSAYYHELLLRAMAMRGTLCKRAEWAEHPACRRGGGPVLMSPELEARITAILATEKPSTMPSVLHMDVYTALEGLGPTEAPLVEHVVAPTLSVDLAFPAARVVVEAMGPSHYDVQTGGLSYRSAAATLRLQGLGWTVMHVPFTVWESMVPQGRRILLAAMLRSVGLVSDEQLKRQDLLHATGEASVRQRVAELTFTALAGSKAAAKKAPATGSYRRSPADEHRDRRRRG